MTRATDPSATAWRKSSHSGGNGNCIEVATWQKSSYSGSNGACIEVATWRKSSHSGTNGNCIEVATSAPEVAIRDSKDPSGPRLAFPPPAWHTFATTLKQTTGPSLPPHTNARRAC